MANERWEALLEDQTGNEPRSVEVCLSGSMSSPTLLLRANLLGFGTSTQWPEMGGLVTLTSGLQVLAFAPRSRLTPPFIRLRKLALKWPPPGGFPGTSLFQGSF